MNVSSTLLKKLVSMNGIKWTVQYLLDYDSHALKSSKSFAETIIDGLISKEGIERLFDLLLKMDHNDSMQHQHQHISPMNQSFPDQPTIPSKKKSTYIRGPYKKQNPLHYYSISNGNKYKYTLNKRDQKGILQSYQCSCSSCPAKGKLNIITNKFTINPETLHIPYQQHSYI